VTIGRVKKRDPSTYMQKGEKKVTKKKRKREKEKEKGVSKKVGQGGTPGVGGEQTGGQSNG